MTPAARAVGDRADDLPRISPELVLVDPELSRRVRPRVPILSAVGDSLRFRRSASVRCRASRRSPGLRRRSFRSCQAPRIQGPGRAQRRSLGRRDRGVGPARDRGVGASHELAEPRVRRLPRDCPRGQVHPGADERSCAPREGACQLRRATRPSGIEGGEAVEEVGPGRCLGAHHLKRRGRRPSTCREDDLQRGRICNRDGPQFAARGSNHVPVQFADVEPRQSREERERVGENLGDEFVGAPGWSSRCPRSRPRTRTGQAARARRADAGSPGRRAGTRTDARGRPSFRRQPSRRAAGGSLPRLRRAASPR